MVTLQQLEYTEQDACTIFELELDVESDLYGLVVRMVASDTQSNIQRILVGMKYRTTLHQRIT